MRLALLTLTLALSTNAYSSVELCHRKAEIARGLVDHYWLKTDTKEAGMGSEVLNEGGQIGDQFEAPYSTKVYIVDHSGQTPLSCKVLTEVDEDCVNEKLDIGKYLGRFTLINNCQTFTRRIIEKCSPVKYSYLND